VEVNDHRAELSVSQLNWPKEMLQNPRGCPVIAVAARIQGFAETLIHLLEKLILWIPEMLMGLSSFLKNELGEKWWIGTPLERFAPGR